MGISSSRREIEGLLAKCKNCVYYDSATGYCTLYLSHVSENQSCFQFRPRRGYLDR